MCTATVKDWRRYGLLKAYLYNDRGECLFEPPGDDAPVRHKRKGLSSHKGKGMSSPEPKARGAV